jgi:DNA polymerase-3 subunit gamma/tau
VSYTVLAVKWRPRRFDQLVGQTHVVQALVNSLAAERLHHAYLFAGTRGVGKTTVARILAKALNCEKGVVSEPCGECAACVAIDEGRFVDLIEVDAASRTRVDDTRELLDNVQYMPTRGRFKVYLIDEVHMLSNHSFNALLKTLEEPPPHVKFLFATTDPQKLPVTVLSRCLQFNLKKLSLAQILGQLQRICAAEDVEAEDEGLKAIAKAADGSLRDALSLLDQAIAFGGGAIRHEEVAGMLGTIDHGHVLRLVDALARGDGAALIGEVAKLDEQAPNFAAALDELMSALQQIAVAQLVPGSAASEQAETYAPFAERMSAEDVQLYYQIALHGRRDLPVCTDERMAFEMTLLRMLAFRPEPAEEGGARSDSAGTPARPPAARPSAAGAAPAAGNAAARAAPPTGETAAEPLPDARGDTAAAAGPRAGAAGAPDEWQALLDAANVRGGARRLADNCVLKALTEQRLELLLDSGKTDFNTQQLRERLQGVISKHLGRDLRLVITAGEPPRATPAEARAAQESERLRAAREAIERDPNIKAVQAAFDAVLEPDSIQPAEKGRGSV